MTSTTIAPSPWKTLQTTIVVLVALSGVPAGRAQETANASLTDESPLPVAFPNIAPYGDWIGSSVYAVVPGPGNLLDESPAALPYAFSTDLQDSPFVDIDLRMPAQIKRVVIVNRDCSQMSAEHNPPAILARAVPMTLFTSKNGIDWTPVWDSQDAQDRWTITFKTPVPTQYLRIQVKKKTFLHLNKVQVFGKSEMPNAPTNLRILATAGALKVGVDDKDLAYLVWSQAPDRPMHLETSLAGERKSPATLHKLAGGVELRRRVQVGKNAASLVERFEPDGTAIKWNVEILGEGDPWSAPMRTRMTWPAAPHTLFWTPWSDGRPDKAAQGWSDPLIPVPFSNRTLTYGGPDPNVTSGGFSLPLFAILENEAGLSWQQAPQDFPINMNMRTTTRGEVAMERIQQRISSAKSVRFAMRFATHEADPRAALGNFVERHEEYFNPPNPRIYEVMGNGTYSSYRGKIDARKYAQQGFLINWRFQEYEYTYMGMFVPPVKSAEEEWVTDQGTTMSLRVMREGVMQSRQQGFHLLSYFNVFEFGRDCQQTDPPPPPKAEKQEDYWKNPNDMAWHVFPDALIYFEPGKLYGGWKSGLAIDPGQPSYSDHLVELARRYVASIPETDGICIDRLDISTLFNERRDDGVSWFKDQPARSLLTSWMSVMERIGPVMHEANKVIVANPIRRRIEMMKHLDGFYDESGQNTRAFNLGSFVALRKPYIAWTQGIQDPTPDEFFQRHLFMGSFVTVPFLGISHTLPPSGPEVDRQYLDYGPLFDALRGREWVLKAGVIRTADPAVKVNVFEVPGGFVVPVGFAGTRASVKVTLQGLPWPEGVDKYRTESIRPGETIWSLLDSKECNGVIELDIPVVRGAAVARLLYTWMSPDARAFAAKADIAMGTTVNGATVRYALGNELPTVNSPEYVSPLAFEQNTMVRSAAFKDGKQLGRTLAREYIQTPPAAPAILPNGGILAAETKVEIRSLFHSDNDPIHYTLDGRDPTVNDPLYTVPLVLSSVATVKARVFAPNGQSGVVAAAQFKMLPPPPPLPAVYISDLPIVRGTTGLGDQPRLNHSITNKPISVAGRVYEKGVGVHSYSELEYDLQPEYRRFVAVVGVDDAMKDVPQASVVFKVFPLKNVAGQQGPAALADVTPLYESPVLRTNEAWTIDVNIPADSKRIRLVVTDAGDGIHCDHADWAVAGFLER